MKLSFLFSLFLAFSEIVRGQMTADINELMMQATFLVTDEGFHSCGTGFVVAKRQTNGVAHVFVTAEHVFRAFAGDNAIIVLRRMAGPDKWQSFLYTNRIRNGTNILYTQHPKLDIAAFYFAPPPDFAQLRISDDLLLTEQIIRDLKLGPGTELLNLGFPFCQVSSGEGFPLLRSGRIASYPIFPFAEKNTFDLTVTVFGGNSGGPVYLSNFEEASIPFTIPPRRHYGVVGMLTTSRAQSVTMVSPDETVTKQIPLGVAGVIHAQFIKETLDLLPKL